MSRTLKEFAGMLSCRRGRVQGRGIRLQRRRSRAARRQLLRERRSDGGPGRRHGIWEGAVWKIFAVLKLDALPVRYLFSPDKLECTPSPKASGAL